MGSGCQMCLLKNISKSPPKDRDQRDPRKSPHLVTIPHGVQLLHAPPGNLKVSSQKWEATEPARIVLGRCLWGLSAVLCGSLSWEAPTKIA